MRPSDVDIPLKNIAADQSGATTLEWTLLLAAIGIPSYFIIRMLLLIVADTYRMNTALNALPFP